MTWAYYNEIDPFAAAWLRQLMDAGHIAPGEVDERSIEDVLPDDIRGFTQCHFFAGIGIWSYALRRAGWGDDRPIWTGSCPCQPFSAAGKGMGFADERHLWPAFFHLIGERRPGTVIGEQVASKDGLTWLDLVQADMEGKDYAVGTVDTCSAGFGAPHVRQRLYWVAISDSWERGRLADGEGRQCYGAQTRRVEGDGITKSSSDAVWLADSSSPRLEIVGIKQARGQRQAIERNGEACGLVHANGGDASTERLQRSRQYGQQQEDSRIGHNSNSGPTNGLWRDADWLFCRDGKWRPVEPGTFPLANGAPARVGRLRGYGNAINAAQAQGFIEAVMESL